MLKITYRNILGIRGFIIKVQASRVKLGEIAIIKSASHKRVIASVISIEGDIASLQAFGNVQGIATDSEVTFINEMFSIEFSQNMFGRIVNGLGNPIDGKGMIIGSSVSINLVSYNPEAREVPSQIVRTGIPMIDVFNCLVRSQKIPIFCKNGDKYNELLIRIAEHTDADAIIIGGMSMTFDVYVKFLSFFLKGENALKTIGFINLASDPIAEAITVPDMALTCANKLALQGKNVLVILSDMTAFAEALKEVAISMDQIPSNRGYPGSLYSDLATRYEQAVELSNGGSVTLISATTMPGNEITHPVPDNTGYITEGQIYLDGTKIDPFKSLSRLKQLVIGKKTRADHAEIANAMIRMYDESIKALDKQMMGFELNEKDEKLIKFASAFESKIMDLSVTLDLEKALDRCWEIMSQFFTKEESGIKNSIADGYWVKKE